LERQPRFRCSLHHSVDRIGTGPQERYSGWFLGMQRTRIDPAADLLRVLPPRFSRSVERIVSPAGLPAKSLFPLHSPSPETSGERAAPARLSPSRTGVTCRQDAHRPTAKMAVLLPPAFPASTLQNARPASDLGLTPARRGNHPCCQNRRLRLPRAVTKRSRRWQIADRPIRLGLLASYRRRKAAR
jgi:hypothetical protein